MTTVNCVNTYIVPTAANELTMPAQPAFLAVLSADDLNVTGNGAVHILGSGNAFTEIYDQNADFNVNGTFTAPVTGRYLLIPNVQIIDAAAATGLIVVLVTSNRNYTTCSCNINLIFNPGSNGVDFGVGVIADMDAADTAIYNITATGMVGNTADIRAGVANRNTYFTGKLIC